MNRRTRVAIAGLAGVALIAFAVLVTVQVTSGGHGNGGASGQGGNRRGAFPLTAASGDGVAWLSWSPPSHCGSGPFEVDRSAGSQGPWDQVQTGLNLSDFKDTGLPDGLHLWYQVLASCSGRNIVSGTASVTPHVSPYNWDFGRAVEGTKGMTEGWTVATSTAGTASSAATSAGAGASPAASTTPSTSTGPSPSRKKHRRARKAKTMLTTNGSQATTTGPAQTAGPVSDSNPTSTPGYLTASGTGRHGAAVAISPRGLQLSAQSYRQLVVDVADPAPSTMKVEWKALGAGKPGAGKWSPAERCTLTPLQAGESECRLSTLGAGWVGTIDQVRLSFPKTSTVSIDRISFAGQPASKPLVGAIRWDAWFPDNGKFVDPSLYTDFDSRHPELGWFDETGTTGPATNLTQRNVDLLAEMQEAHAGGIDFWAFDWFPGTSNGSAGGFPSGLSEYQSYLAGLKGGERPLVDYALIIGAKEDQKDRQSKQTTTLPYWTKVQVPRLVQDFRSHAYVKVDGNRPLVYWHDLQDLGTKQGFGSCQGGCWQLALSSLITQTKAAGLGAPYMVDTDSDPTDAVKYGLEALTSYGPEVMSPIGYQTSGHQGWEAGAHSPVAVDTAVANQDSPNGHGGLLAVQPPLTPTLDHRPYNAGTQYAAIHSPDSATFWFDYPTYSQWQAHFADTYDQLQLYPGRSSDPGVTLIYSWNEVSEGGGIQPSSTYGSYLLDAVAAVRSGTEPASMWDIWDDSNVAINYRGKWTEQTASPETLPGGKERPGPSTPVPAAYGDDEHIDPNAAPGDSATIHLDPSTAVRILATTGPDRGIEAITLDGSTSTVNLYSPTYQAQVVVFSQSGLPATSHRLRITTTGKKDSRATNSLIGVDAVEALVTGIGRQAPGPLAPDRLTATGLDGSAQLSWDPVANASGYSVYRSASPGGPWKVVGRPGQSNQRLQWTDLTLPSGWPNLWYYQVKADSGRQQGQASDAVPVITVPDFAAGGQTSSGSSPSGQWTQVIFGGTTSSTVDEIDFSHPMPAGPLTVEVTSDHGSTWKPVYQSTSQSGLASSHWLTFPPTVADGVRISTDGDPPAFGVYLR
jgi:hypothetical protein